VCLGNHNTEDIKTVKQQPLYERYRPKSLDEIIGQPKAVKIIERLERNQSLHGNAYWISGASGTGKTSLARIVASLVSREAMDTLEIDANDLNNTESFDDAAETLSISGWGGGRTLIVNEAHGLHSRAIRKLLVFLENLPTQSVVIFTTTKEGEASLFEDYDDSAPLLSRCIKIALTNQGLARPFALRAKEIAIQEGLDGKRDDAYYKLAQNSSNNFRTILQSIQAGDMCDNEEKER